MSADMETQVYEKCANCGESEEDHGSKCATCGEAYHTWLTAHRYDTVPHVMCRGVGGEFERQERPARGD